MNPRAFLNSYAVLKANDEKMDVIWSITNSPIAGQWRNLFLIIAKSEESKTAMLQHKRNFNNLEEVLKHDITMNCLDLWYVYLYLYLRYK